LKQKKKAAAGSRPLMPLILILLGALLITGVLVWQAMRSRSTAQNPPPTATQAAQAGLPFPEVSRIAPQDAKQALDEQTALFLDVRDAGSYSKGHIPGAINLPVDEIEARASELDPNQWIITYCT